MTGGRALGVVVSGAAVMLAAPAAAQDVTAERALIDELDQRLLASPTATGTLTRWCAEHGLADPARIHAELVTGAISPATAEQRTRLGVGPDEPLGYRRVKLMCGTHLMSEAENWYVPARLTPAMRDLLATSDTPFGTVIRPLNPSRRNLEAVQLWREGPLPRDILRHRALVLGGDGQPLAEVVETYKSSALPVRR
ncbi:hypothetical protein P1X14_07270 [Sphingomonas sp. AOB5]|uniref:hypothetical protein n=1 Tax=Sphingomonas sp. AOB5 TaxID=3034017 RepID=UPI0023F93B2D|nr:hypothetical protein [Sphingomonas sp. AOB5]MDF7775040.1 hypothetical protein [Sphingomonas sp. AOB5]